MTLKESILLKGLAIISVIFHNYWHITKNAPLENEFILKNENLYKFITALIKNPYNFLEPISSFIGVYGVYIFIFISGYGLTRKTQTNKFNLYMQYKLISKQIIKTILLIITSLPIIFILKISQYNSNLTIELQQLLQFLKFTTNLSTNTLFTFVSVWWFIPLLFQLYLFFPIGYKAILKYKFKPICIIIIISTICGYYNQEIIKYYNIYVFATPLTLSSIFLFGIYTAQNNSYSNIWIYIAILLLTPSLSSRYLFGISFFIITLIQLHIFEKIKNRLTTSKTIYWIGINSPFIFIIHGETRLKLINYANLMNDIYIYYICFVIYLILALIFSQFHKRIYTYLMKYAKIT